MPFMLYAALLMIFKHNYQNDINTISWIIINYKNLYIRVKICQYVKKQGVSIVAICFMV